LTLTTKATAILIRFSRLSSARYFNECLTSEQRTSNVEHYSDIISFVLCQEVFQEAFRNKTVPKNNGPSSDQEIPWDWQCV